MHVDVLKIVSSKIILELYFNPYNVLKTFILFVFILVVFCFMLLGFIVNVFNNGKNDNACLLFEGLVK